MAVAACKVKCIGHSLNSDGQVGALNRKLLIAAFDGELA